MALFHFGKKKDAEKKAPACACGCGKVSSSAASVLGGDNACCAKSVVGDGLIKVLGSGCKNCHALLENAEAAVRALGLSAQVEYVTDMEKVMAYGVMQLPALVVNEQVVSKGKVLKPAEVEQLLRDLGM